MKINQTIYTKGKGIAKEGVIVGFEGNKVLVDFNEGRISKMLPFVLTTKAPKAKKVKTQDQNSTMKVADVKNFLMDFSQGFQKEVANLPLWAQIMEEADKANHFASEVVFRAKGGKSISEKQAWATAYFAKKVGLAK